MSSILRTLERNTVKENIKKDGRSIKNCFETEWKKYRENKYVTKDEEGNIISNKTPKNTMKKKQQHFDSMEQYTRFFNYVDSLKSEEVKEENKKTETN